MKKKKRNHRQVHGVSINNSMGLRVGGVVVPYWPSYYGGMGYYGNTTNITHEGASNANNSDAASNAGGGEGASLSY